jgi:hypothetical protein
MKMERILRKTIADGIVEQITIGGRILVEFT